MANLTPGLHTVTHKKGRFNSLPDRFLMQVTSTSLGWVIGRQVVVTDYTVAMTEYICIRKAQAEFVPFTEDPGDWQ